MTGGKNRYYSYKKAKRAKRIDVNRNSVFTEYPWYNNLHQYSKGKIFCSCYLCRNKTRDKKKKDNWSLRDKRSFDKLSYDEFEI